MELVEDKFIEADEEKGKTIADKLALFTDLRELTPKEKEAGVRSEREKSEIYFLPALSKVTYNELKMMLEFLREYGVKITHARNIKDTVNEISRVRGGISLLEEVDAVKIYALDPSKLSHSAFDISSRIKYCQLNNMEYKNADGSYKDFIFNEKAFNLEKENFQSVSPRQVEASTPIAQNVFESQDSMNQFSDVFEANPKSDVQEDRQRFLDEFNSKFLNEEPTDSMYIDDSNSPDAKIIEIQNEARRLEELRNDLSQFNDSLVDNNELISFEEITRGNGRKVA